MGRGLRQVAWWTAAGLLLGLAGASAPAFVAASGDTLLHDEVAAYGQAPRALSINVASNMAPDVFDEADAHLRDAFAEVGLPSPHRRLLAGDVTLDGPNGAVGLSLIGVEGALEHLPPITHEGAGEVAITEWSRALLGLEPGAVLRLVGPFGEVDLPLGPVVESFDYQAMPAFWQPVTGRLADDGNILTGSPPPSLLMEPATVSALVETLHYGARDHDLDVVGPGTGATDAFAFLEAGWDVVTDPPPGLDEARTRLVPALAEIERRAVDPSTPVGEWLAMAMGGQFGARPIVTGQLTSAVERAEQVLALIGRPVVGLGLAAQALGLAVVVVASLQAFRSRLSRARLFAVRGVAPLRLGVLAGGLALAPLSAGIATGWGVVFLVARRAAGDGVVAPILDAGRLQAVAALVLATVSVALTIAITAAVRSRTVSGAARVPPVVEVVLVVLAGLVWWARDADARPILQRPDGTTEVDLLAFVLPLLLVLAVTAVGARVGRRALQAGVGLADRSGRAWRWHGGAYVAFRRLRSLPTATVTMVFVTSAGLGLFVAAATLTASARVTVAEKAGLLVGADAAVDLPRADANRTAELERLGGLATAGTHVQRINDGLLNQRRDVEVLVVDPASFAEVAYQPRGAGAARLGDLVAALDTDVGPRVAAVAVGEGVPDRVVLQVPGVEVDVEVVARTTILPGVTGERPALVFAVGGPLSPEDVATRARLQPHINHEWWFADGGGAGDEFPGDVTRADALADAPTVAPVVAVFGFVRGQAIAIAALGLVALLAQQAAQARSRALSGALLGRMGLSRRSRLLAEAVEFGVLVTAGVALGVGAGSLTARVVAADYDPLPAVPLPVVVTGPGAVITVVVAVAAVAVVVGVWLAHRQSARADVASLLREAA